jgi:UDP:flavonoid glycosyltransferase YjiC (YdhE family)
VKSECALYAELKPAAVVIGFTLSVYLSARSAKVPLVYVMPFPLTRPFLQAGLAEWPDAFDLPLLNLIPKSARDRWTNRWLLKTRLWTGPFRRVAAELDLPLPEALVDLYEGDFNLVTDIPELTGVPKLPPDWQYIGPIFARLPGEVPAEIMDLPRPWIYCAMGSSANREILKTVLEGFAELPYAVVAPVQTHLQGMNLRLPQNVHVYDWLPAHKVNPLADLAVIHGGQGTVQTACVSGTPFVGIGLQPEQEANIAAVARWGSAVRLSKRRLSQSTLRECVTRLMANTTARARARDLQALLAHWDGADRAARFICEQFI